MRKYDFSRKNIKNFFKKHSFKLAITLSVLGLGIAAYSALGSLGENTEPAPNDAVSRPVEQIVSGITGETSSKNNGVSSENTSSTESEASKPEENTPSNKQESSQPNEPETPTLSYPEFFYLPVNGKVSKGFSDSAPVFSATMGDWRAHNGTDFAAEKGERVIATADGIVTDVRYDEAWGYIVDVDHGGGLYASYRNLNDDVQVEAGEFVNAGQLLAGLGSGGYEECNDGTHLHIEMTLNGKFVDPVTVMNKKTA